MCFKGSVGTDEKCPKCHGKFELIDIEHGYICKHCFTHPKRFWISARALKIPNKLYSDRLGNVFDSYQLAVNQWSAMNSAYRESLQPNGQPWNPDDWIPAKVREQLFQHRAQQFIECKRPFFERRKLSRDYWNGLNNIILNFLVPYFSDKDVRAISKEDIKLFYLYLLDLRDSKGEPYSDAHIKHILDFLKSIFHEYRPADIPEFPDHAVLPKREKQWLGIERQMTIEPHVPHKYRLAIQTLQYTGMRCGEVRALQVSDMVDGALKVWKAFSDHKDKKGNSILKLCRKAGGEVTYPIHLDLWNDLQAHVEGKAPDDFIFTSDGKRPLGKGRLYKIWKKACEDAGVKYIPLQQASRHSMASQIMADAKKKAIEEIQRKLGHFNKTTQKHYVIE